MNDYFYQYNDVDEDDDYSYEDDHCEEEEEMDMNMMEPTPNPNDVQKDMNCEFLFKRDGVEYFVLMDLVKKEGEGENWRDAWDFIGDPKVYPEEGDDFAYRYLQGKELEVWVSKYGRECIEEWVESTEDRYL